MGVLTLGPLPQSDFLLCMVGLRLREGLLSSACPSGLSTQGDAYTRAMKSLVVGAVDIHDWCILRMLEKNTKGLIVYIS